MEFRILGPLEVSSDAGDVPLGGAKKRALLAALLLHANEAVSVERLVDELWPASPPKTAEKTVRVYVSQLRKALDGDGRLERHGRGYMLKLDDDDLDATRFEALITEGRDHLAAGKPDRAAVTLTNALGLWRGPPLADFVYEPFAQSAIARLEERRLVCLEERIEADLALGRHEDVVAELEALVRDHPLRERLRGQLMLALYRSGRQSEALDVYQSTRRTLVEEVGLEPGPSLQALERQILNQDSALAAPRRETARVGAGRRPAWLFVAGGALVLAAALAAVLVEVVGSDEAKLTSIAANAVGVVDPDTNRLVAQIPVERTPTAIATGLDAVWVVNADDQTVSRINPETSAVVDSIPVRGGPAGVAVCKGAVWVANGLDGTVSRIDPTTNQEAQTIPVGNGPSGVACGEGAVWVTNSADDTVTRIDPDTGRPSKTFAAVVGASGVAVGFGRVWVVSPPSGTVVALDPRSGQVLQTIGVGVDPNAVAVGAGAVWVANRASSTVTKITPQTQTEVAAVKDTIAVGRGPEGVAADTESVWVARGAQGTLIRLDPSTGGIIKRVPLGNPARGVALTPQGVFAVVGSTGREHRGGVLRAIGKGVLSIDPALAYDLGSLAVFAMTNDGLVGFRKVGGVQGAQLVPDLADELPTAADGGRSYTFRVRQGIRYSSGKLVQPDDFRRALQRVFELGSPGAPYYDGIVGADRCQKGTPCDLSRGIVTDRAARTVRFLLTAPDSDFLAKLALNFAFAVPEGTPARDLGIHSFPATGPYKIAQYRPKANTLRLVRNRRYRQWSADAQPQGYPDAISLSWAAASHARVRAVVRGAADIGAMGALPKAELDVLAARYRSQLRLNSTFSTTSFFLNSRVPPFDDLRVRRAVNQAFDRGAFTRQLGGVPTCQILPPNFPGYRPSCPYLQGGPRAIDTARRLVRSSGTTGARVIVWWPKCPECPVAGVGLYLVSVLDSLGFRASLRTVRGVDPYFDKVFDRRVRAQSGFSIWFADYPSAVGVIPPQFSCAGEGNIAGFCDRSIDAEMGRATALQAQDPPAATLLWQRIEHELLAQAPVVPAYNGPNVDFVSKRVGNYQYNPQWGALLDQMWVR
jgi:YVTN family beta-propeller protein